MRPAIELFGNAWCPPCGKAKEIIRSTQPESKGVKFLYIDVGDKPEYEMRALPIIFVGDQILEGLSEPALKSALDRLYASVLLKPTEPKPEPPPEPSLPPAPPSKAQPDAPADTSQQTMVWGLFLVLGFTATVTFLQD